MGWANRLTVARGVLALVLWGVLHTIAIGYHGIASLWWEMLGALGLSHERWLGLRPELRRVIKASIWIGLWTSTTALG